MRLRRPERILALAVLAAYAGVVRCGFVSYDDPEYVTQNPMVLGGLSARAVGWALTRGYAGNWHPLTWLSHMLDVSLFGLAPLGHHATSVALHVANTLVVFLALAAATSSRTGCGSESRCCRSSGSCTSASTASPSATRTCHRSGSRSSSRSALASSPSACACRRRRVRAWPPRCSRSSRCSRSGRSRPGAMASRCTSTRSRSGATTSRCTPSWPNELADAGRVDEALAQYREALHLRPDFPYAHYGLALLLEERGDPARAMAEYRAALAVNPDFVQARFNLANLLGRSGQLDEAGQQYERVLALEPDHEGARQGLALVERLRGGPAAGYSRGAGREP